MGRVLRDLGWGFGCGLLCSLKTKMLPVVEEKKSLELLKGKSFSSSTLSTSDEEESLKMMKKSVEKVEKDQEEEESESDDLFELTTEDIRESSLYFERNSYYGTPRFVSLVIAGSSIGSDGVVKYHIDVKGPQGLLSTYTIRRRYTDFKRLHEQLSKIMNHQKSSFLTSSRFSSTSSSSSSFYHPQEEEDDEEEEKANHIVLPDLPTATVWSYLRRHDKKLVEKRMAIFQKILDAAAEHPDARYSHAFDTFLSFAPSSLHSRGSSYVSLNDYSVPKMDSARESMERKQFAQRIKERRRSASSESVGQNI